MSISGKALQAQIDGIFVHGNFSWQIEEDGDELDGTTAESGGFEDPEIGVYKGRITLKGYMSVIDGTYTPVRRGTVISDLKLFRDITDAVPAFDIPSAISLRSNQGGEVRGKVEWGATIATKGQYTYNDP